MMILLMGHLFLFVKAHPIVSFDILIQIKKIYHYLFSNFIIFSLFIDWKYSLLIKNCIILFYLMGNFILIIVRENFNSWKTMNIIKKNYNSNKLISIFFFWSIFFSIRYFYYWWENSLKPFSSLHQFQPSTIWNLTPSKSTHKKPS